MLKRFEVEGAPLISSHRLFPLPFPSSSTSTSTSNLSLVLPLISLNSKERRKTQSEKKRSERWWQGCHKRTTQNRKEPPPAPTHSTPLAPFCWQEEEERKEKKQRKRTFLFLLLLISLKILIRTWVGMDGLKDDKRGLGTEGKEKRKKKGTFGSCVALAERDDVPLKCGKQSRALENQRHRPLCESQSQTQSQFFSFEDFLQKREKKGGEIFILFFFFLWFSSLLWQADVSLRES